MTMKANIEPDAAPSRTVATGALSQWHQNRQNLRDAVPTKSPRGAPPANPKFDRTYDGIKVNGLVSN